MHGQKHSATAAAPAVALKEVETKPSLALSLSCMADAISAGGVLVGLRRCGVAWRLAGEG